MTINNDNDKNKGRCSAKKHLYKILYIKCDISVGLAVTFGVL